MAEASKQRETAPGKRKANMGTVVNSLLLIPPDPAADCPIGGVGIVSILDKLTGPSRAAPAKAFKAVIEVPAELIDAGETPEECAVRGLMEETGYVGVAEKISSVMFNGRFDVSISGAL